METFTWQPNREVQVEYKDNVLISIAENGVEQRRFKYSQKIFTLNFLRKKSTIDAIESFYNARQNGVEAFNWIDPIEGTTYKVRFVPNSLKKRFVGSASKPYWQLTLQFIEVED